MKKIAILLLAVVTLSLTSCGGSEEKVETTVVDTTMVAVPVDSALVAVDSTLTVTTTTVK